MAEAIRVNVVDGPLSWQRCQLIFRGQGKRVILACRPLFRCNLDRWDTEKALLRIAAELLEGDEVVRAR